MNSRQISQRIQKPWGWEIIFAHTNKYIGKILHINAGQALSLQYHNFKDETIMIQYGRIQLEYFTEHEGKNNKHILNMVPGDSFHIKPGLRHRMIACQDADIVEVSTPELDDVIRLEDRYGRIKRKEKYEKGNFIVRFFGWLRSRFNRN